MRLHCIDMAAVEPCEPDVFSSQILDPFSCSLVLSPDVASIHLPLTRLEHQIPASYPTLHNRKLTLGSTMYLL